MPNKTCTKCGIEKHLADFQKLTRSKDGLRPICKVCGKVYKDTYRAKPSSRVKERKTAVDWRRKNPIKFMLYCAKARANKDGLPFSLNFEDIVVPAVCPILGIPLFQNLDTGKHGPSPNSPSLDKIRPELGYVAGNVQVISNRANTMKQDASLEEIVALGRWAQSRSMKEG
jgi:hypothetical protein